MFARQAVNAVVCADVVVMVRYGQRVAAVSVALTFVWYQKSAHGKSGYGDTVVAAIVR